MVFPLVLVKSKILCFKIFLATSVSPVFICFAGKTGDVPALTPHFCGREEIVSCVLEQVMSSEGSRIICVDGPPGFGKTGIVVAVSQDLVKGGKVRVSFVSLRGVHQGEQALVQITNALLFGKGKCCSEHSLRDLINSINSPLLIVLDNSEDFLDSQEENSPISLSDIVKEMVGINDYVKNSCYKPGGIPAACFKSEEFQSR